MKKKMKEICSWRLPWGKKKVCTDGVFHHLFEKVDGRGYRWREIDFSNVTATDILAVYYQSIGKSNV